MGKSATTDRWRIWTVSLFYKNLRLLSITSLEMPLYAGADIIFMRILQKRENRRNDLP